MYSYIPDKDSTLKLLQKMDSNRLRPDAALRQFNLHPWAPANKHKWNKSHFM